MSGLPVPDAVCDGGDLDCGSGLLLIIRNALGPVAPGGVLEVRSREVSVKEDLPAWCRMVGHAIVDTAAGEHGSTSYFLRKKGGDEELAADVEQARAFRWKVRARWTDGMRATAYARNHAIEVGQPASFDTDDAAPSAVELLLSALAGCLAVGFRWRATARGLEVRNLEVAVTAGADNVLVFLGLEDEGHPGLAAVEGRLYVDCDGADDAVEAIWAETLARSPVAQSLLRTVPLDLELRRA